MQNTINIGMNLNEIDIHKELKNILALTNLKVYKKAL